MATTRRGEKAGTETRQRVLAAGLELFAGQGLGATTLEAIAARAGVSRPGLLHHFATKRELLLAVFDEYSRQSLEPWLPEGVTMPATLDDLDLEADGLPQVGIHAALKIAEQVAAVNAKNRRLVQLAHLCAAEPAGSDPVAAEWARSRHRRVRRFVATAVRHSLERGEIRADADPDLVGAFVVAAFEGLENQWLLDPAFDVLRHIQAFLSLLRRDLDAR